MGEYYQLTFTTNLTGDKLAAVAEAVHRATGSPKTILFTIDGVPIHWIER